MSGKQKNSYPFRLPVGEDKLATEQAFVRLGTILTEIANASEQESNGASKSEKHLVRLLLKMPWPVDVPGEVP
jgi:hypothetical protein